MDSLSRLRAELPYGREQPAGGQFHHRVPEGASSRMAGRVTRPSQVSVAAGGDHDPRPVPQALKNRSPREAARRVDNHGLRRPSDISESADASGQVAVFKGGIGKALVE